MQQFVSRLVGAAFLACCALSAAAQTGDYPNRPIKVVVPWGAGGVVDSVARHLMPKVSEVLGQPIVVDNRVGGVGIIGAHEVVQSKPDGYTFLMVFDTLAVAPEVLKKMPFDPFTDLEPVSLLVRAPLVAVAASNFPANNIPELIAYAKANPNKISYGSTGAGSSAHLATELFARQAGISMLHVPYKAGATLRTDLMGGHLQFFWGSTAFTKPMVDSGKVKALGQAGHKRSHVYPEVPTATEQGVRGFDAYLWMGLSAPKATPEPIISKFHSALLKVVAMPDVKASLAAQGFDVVISTPQEFGSYMRSEHAKWSRVIRDAKIVLE